jgi:hypothetical protein
MSKRKGENEGNEELDFEAFIKDKTLKKEAPQVLQAKNFRTEVCSFWLQGQCVCGDDDCPYLHKFDKSRMPPCKIGKLCKIKNCPLKHSEETALVECLFFKQGFCIKGPLCKLRHVKRRPEERPLEANFEACAGGSTLPGGVISATMQGKIKRSNAQKENYKSTLCSHWLREGTCTYNDSCTYAHGEGTEINDSNQGEECADDLVIYDPTRGNLTARPAVPYTMQSKVSYFLFQAPDLISLATSKRRGVWAVTVLMADKINAAIKSSPDGVLAFMCIRSFRGVYGVVKITGMIPPARANSQITPEFPVKWFRTCRVALRTIANMKFNTGMFVGKSPSDGQFDLKDGYDLLLICTRKPAWDWSQPEELLRAVEGRPSGEIAYRQPALKGEPDKLFDDDWVERMTTATVAYMNAYQRNKTNLHTTAVLGTQDRYGNFTGGEVSSDYYTGESPGYIFMANNLIIAKEMITKRLFGVPASMADIVIHPGAPLFVCDMQFSNLYGIFTSDTAVSTNIDPTAFCTYPGAPSNFPIQLRVTVAHECRPIQLIDEDLRAIFTTGSKFEFKFGDLSLEITKKLSNLFATRAGLTLGGIGGAIMGLTGGRMPGRSGAQAPGTVTGMYKPQFKYVDEVPIDIKADIHQIKRLVLGYQAANINKIRDELGDMSCIKIRIRGIGSGYNEGPEAKELPEPLHFNVCADSEHLLSAVVLKVKALVDSAREALCGGGGR